MHARAHAHARAKQGVEIMYMGSLQYVGGTSCAAPVFSAIIALINDER
jgi:subtilase family serine protease